MKPVVFALVLACMVGLSNSVLADSISGSFYAGYRAARFHPNQPEASLFHLLVGVASPTVDSLLGRTVIAWTGLKCSPKQVGGRDPAVAVFVGDVTGNFNYIIAISTTPGQEDGEDSVDYGNIGRVVKAGDIVEAFAVSFGCTAGWIAFSTELVPAQ